VEFRSCCGAAVGLWVHCLPVCFSRFGLVMDIEYNVGKSGHVSSLVP